MDDEAERLRRRTALYRSPHRGTIDAIQTAEFIKLVQRDTASFIGGGEDPQSLTNAGPAYLRGRAAHYRELAAQQSDPKRAQLFRDLADSFEKHAEVKERPVSPKL